jgi:hypothetical protein
LRKRLLANSGTGDDQDEPASIQLGRLEAAKGIERREHAAVPGVIEMKRNVRQILEEAKDWIDAQELAELYGIKFGSTPEDIEPFFAELRELDVEGHLKVKAITDGAGAKVGGTVAARETSLTCAVDSPEDRQPQGERVPQVQKPEGRHD